MEEKENVYGLEQKEAGTGAEAQEGAEGENRAKETGSIAKKFKSVDALEKAYESLQAEFTRKSQRLKELERLTENSEGAKGKNAGQGAVEKLRRRAETVKAETKQFDCFVAGLQEDKEQAQEPIALDEPEKQKSLDGATGAQCLSPAQTEGENAGSEGENRQEKARNEGKSTECVAKERETAYLTDDELFERAKQNETVRLKIIGDYLSSVGKSSAPLMRGGAGTLSAPPLKAKTVEQAGRMALRWFTRENS